MTRHPKKERVLLHICCGVCAFYCIEYLNAKGYALEGFFYNPNISPLDEYNLRRDAARKVCQIMNIAFNEAEYATELWQAACSSYENEPEGGSRCRLCYEMRLGAARDFAKSRGFDYFTTTLTISPHKDSLVISEIARRLAGQSFLEIDFKKNNGFARSLYLAKTHAIYRQRYCGCLYGRRQQETKAAKKQQ